MRVKLHVSVKFEFEKYWLDCNFFRWIWIVNYTFLILIRKSDTQKCHMNYIKTNKYSIRFRKKYFIHSHMNIRICKILYRTFHEISYEKHTWVYFRYLHYGYFNNTINNLMKFIYVQWLSNWNFPKKGFNIIN